MSFAKFSELLNKLRESLPDQVLENEELKNTIDELKMLIPSIEKETQNAQLLLDTFVSWQKQNQNLQNVLSSLSGLPPQDFIAPTMVSENISNDSNVSSKNKSNSRTESQSSTSSLEILPKTSDLLNEIPTDISGSVSPKSIHESYLAPVESNINKNDYYTENETMDQLQVDMEGLEAFIAEKKISPTIIDGKRYFAKRKVVLVRSTAMELSTIVVSKPKKTGLFGKDEGYTVQNADVPNMDDYYTENETMDQLQVDMEGLEAFIAEKKISPTIIDGKRYFTKRKVNLIRSTTMELSTIVIKKPKKSSLKFWEND